MHRVASLWAAAAAFALAACGDPRVVEAPAAGTSGCASCHTAPGEGPPFRDQTGSTDPRRLTVGAHDAHLHGPIVASIPCSECHTQPRAISDPGHLDDAPTDISFGPLARTGGANPTYDRGTNGCLASYCHGNFPGGNASNTPRWLGGALTPACGTCHAMPPATGRHAKHADEAIACAQCHGTFLPANHVNGVKDVTLPAWSASSKTCAQACHEPRRWLSDGGGD